MIEHAMVLKKVFEDGGELWICPICDKELIIHPNSPVFNEEQSSSITHKRSSIMKNESYIEFISDEELERDWNESV